MVLKEVKVDDDAVAKPATPTTPVPAGRQCEPFHLRDGAGVGSPSPERQVAGVLLATGAGLDVVQRAATTDEECGHVLVLGMQGHPLQA